MSLVKKGWFSNFSDLVRTGIRSELKEIKPMDHDFDEEWIYKDKELIKGVMKSMNQAKEGKGRVLKSDKEIDKFFKEL